MTSAATDVGDFPEENRSAAHVRESRTGDEDALARLRTLLWPDCPPERHRLERAQFQASRGIVAVAEAVGGELVGFAEVSMRREHVEGTTAVPIPYLEGWFVHPAWRAGGVGRALIAFVERWAIAQGFHELASDAELDNGPGIAAHAALGFTEVGRGVHFVKRLRS